MVKVEASKFFPGLPDPIKNMRNHSARLNSVVSEYCSCSPGAKSTPKTKARAPGEVKSADNAEWVTVASKPGSWPVFQSLVDISCCSVTLKEHHSHPIGPCGSVSDPCRAVGLKSIKQTQKQLRSGPQINAPNSPDINGVTRSLAVFGEMFAGCFSCLHCTCRTTNIWVFTLPQFQHKNCLVLSAQHRAL